ncbi:SirB2 family protein [Aquabacterium humicola]|uniref:SirB2 family protein n=1 Tax=Aquabacterium humicola TaxID=3237377 RepID=UPI002542B2EA|nr:SirB2 family protein [Rubrivivax pictus]
MDYPLLKSIHQAAVALSFAGFFARGAAALAGAAWVRSRPARTLPHIVDSVLLLSALAMAFALRLSPLEAPWLLAKILGLLAYIGLGVVALRPSTPLPLRALAWLAALATFVWIVTVAITKRPAGFFAFT